jgi:hypothetical protein
LDCLVLCNLQNGRGQQILDWSFRLLNDVSKAVKHVAQAVWLPLVVQHLIQEYVQRLITQKVGIESRDFAGLQEDRAQRFHDEGVVMDVEHLYQVAHDVVVIQLLVQVVELHQEVQHVDDVQQYFEDQRIVLDVAVVLQKLNASRDDVVVLLVRLHEHVVVESLHDQKHYLHEVEEAQVLLGLVVSEQDELHDILEVVLVRDLLDVL